MGQIRNLYEVLVRKSEGKSREPVEGLYWVGGQC